MSVSFPDRYDTFYNEGLKMNGDGKIGEFFKKHGKKMALASVGALATAKALASAHNNYQAYKSLHSLMGGSKPKSDSDTESDSDKEPKIRVVKPSKRFKALGTLSGITKPDQGEGMEWLAEIEPKFSEGGGKKRGRKPKKMNSKKTMNSSKKSVNVKEVMAYKWKNGVSLKEAWEHFKN